MQLLRTTQALPTEEFRLFSLVDLDGQGKPIYAAPADFRSNVTDYWSAERGDEFFTQNDGSRVRVVLTLYLRGDSVVVPEEEDRIVRVSDGLAYIVVRKNVVQGLRFLPNQPDHFRLHLREE